MNIQCLGLCEVRWPGVGEFYKEDKHIFYSGGTEHQHIVGLILDRHFGNFVLSFWPKSEQVMSVTLKASPFNVNIIVIYVPTSEADDHKIDYFYEELE